MSSAQPLELNLLLTGDAEVGKRYLLFSAGCHFFSQHVACLSGTSSDNQVQLDGLHLSVHVRAAPGEDHWDPLRPKIYPRADCIVISFSVASPSSFERVKTKWLLEARLHAKDRPILLVGTKSDLRTDTAEMAELRKRGHELVPRDDAEALAKEIGAERYIECSCEKNNVGVAAVFEAAIRSTAKFKQRNEKPKGACNLQ